MRDDLRLRNYSRRKQQTYLDHVARFARHFGRSPEHLGAEEVRVYPLHLIEEKHVSWEPLQSGSLRAALSVPTTLGQGTWRAALARWVAPEGLVSLRIAGGGRYWRDPFVSSCVRVTPAVWGFTQSHAATKSLRPGIGERLVTIEPRCSFK